jgi:PAS domain S-box-containing protein
MPAEGFGNIGGEDVTSIAVVTSKAPDAAENWLAHTLESMGEAIIATDESGRVVFINALAERLTGWTHAEALGQEIASVYRAIDEVSGDAVQRFLLDIARGGDVVAVKVEMELVARDGSRLAIQDSAAPIRNATGLTKGVVVVFRDATAQRDARRKLEEFNQRLRQAVAETNHRVKNDLQVIAALVDLQADEADGSLAAGAKQKLSMHIQTLAQIHDLLSNQAKTSEDLTYVSAHETLSKLVPMVQATVANRLVSFTGESIRLPTQQSSSLALIVNELVANALKHGRGAVEINLLRTNGTVSVDVLDDGPGFPEGFDIQTSAHNGLMLAVGLAKTDLNGEITCNNRPEGGGRVTLRFPVKS